MAATSIVLKDFWMYWRNALDTGRDASSLLCGMCSVGNRWCIPCDDCIVQVEKIKGGESRQLWMAQVYGGYKMHDDDHGG